jgi:hypothetical protein
MADQQPGTESDNSRPESATNRVAEGSTEVEMAMLGGAPGLGAVGREPSDPEPYSQKDYVHPTAGWGAARSVAHVLIRDRELVEGARVTFTSIAKDGSRRSVYGCRAVTYNIPPARLRATSPSSTSYAPLATSVRRVASHS